MAEQIGDVVLPHLRYDAPQDNKGLLIVGNYGPGRVWRASSGSSPGLAEHSDLAKSLRHATIEEKVGPVAGRFKVVRTEDAVHGDVAARRRLRRTRGASEVARGRVPVPPADKVTNNKDLFVRMMGAFQEVLSEPWALARRR